MTPGVLADLVLGVHAAFVLFVAVGGLLAVRWGWIVWAHLPCAAWGAWISLVGGVCPLTPLENRLRRQAGEAAYETTFLDRYVAPILYPDGLSREIQVGMGVAVLVLNAALYLWLWRRHVRKGSEADAAVVG